MAINSIKQTDQNGVGHLACDDASDIANLTAYSKSNNLRLGSDCIVVDTGAVMMQKSDFTWKEI